MQHKQSYNAIGIMSGTSLDGIDIAHCTFSFDGNYWDFKLNETETIPYEEKWLLRLQTVFSSSAADLAKTHSDYGHLLGKTVQTFIKKTKLQTDFIASHGHTIFHQPENNFTFQIGDGATISSTVKLPVISDFRSSDIALGGQGAPLVPVGDHLLFPKEAFCLNLGGFANISHKKENSIIAYDICPANIVLNEIAQRKLNIAFDTDGNEAKKGNLIPELLQQLNALSYYQQQAPKSLGKEWVDEFIWPIINEYNLQAQDLLRTYCEHIAHEISNACEIPAKKSILTTGGGAHNKFLIERITENTNHKIQIPTNEIVNYKEALIFAFLGVLRIREEHNCLSSATGAKNNNIGGCIYIG